MLASISAAEYRQDTSLCLTHDLKRHVEQAASEKALCCSCRTCFELTESVFIGYCPCLRFLPLRFGVPPL